MATETLLFNGIDASTGQYLLETTPQELVEAVKGETQVADADHASELKQREGSGSSHYNLIDKDIATLETFFKKEIEDFEGDADAQQILGDVIKGIKTLQDQKFEDEHAFKCRRRFLAALQQAIPPSAFEDYQDVILERARKAHEGAVEGVNPNKLEEAGWGVIFASNADPAIKEALKELLDWRREQAGKYYKEYSGDAGYQVGKQDSKRAFLKRHGAGPGPADPDNVPYYLMIVGDPETIPYQFQYHLDVQYAVGRIHFDTLNEYRQYAHSVVESEKRGAFLPRQATFWGVQNPDDTATNLSAEHLIQPLAKFLTKDQPDWMVQTFLAEDARKAQLAKLLGGDQTPAFLFTASHGMGFPAGHEQQCTDQGALLCQDWQGPKRHQGPVTKDLYFAADDVEPDGNLFGLMAFCFACFGAGTPKLNDFAHRGKTRSAIAPQAFLAQLPKRLLSHPTGGALALVGHVERAWGYSFLWDGAGAQLGAFESTLKRLLEGHTIGSALEYFNQRYAELSTEISAMQEDMKFGKKVNPIEMAGLWTANNDARSYVIIGDPAVRLPVTKGKTTKKSRPKLEAIHFQETPAPEETPPSPPESATEGTGLDNAPDSDNAASTDQNTDIQKEPDMDNAIAGKNADINDAAAVPAPEESAATEFGLFESVDKTKAKLTSALQQFSEKLGPMLEKAIDDVASLEVATYAGENMNDVGYDIGKGAFTGAALRAVTRINLDGDTHACVPEKNGKVDDDLWAIHCEMVKQAQAQRSELLKTLISTTTGILDILKGL